MRLPALENPASYTGLYVFDFGDQTAVGYTAEEIAVLLESERYADGKVYRIHRALPDGTMELAGVPRERLLIEDGLLFFRAGAEAAKADFEKLAGADDPPCRMKLQLATLDGAEPVHVTAAIFPAESTHDVAAWMERIGFNGGDRVEGGPAQVDDYHAAGPTVLERKQFWSSDARSRSADEVLSTTHLAVQRVPT